MKIETAMRGLLLVLVMALGAASVPVAAMPAPVRVLFVGNSLTYVGNLPAVLDAVATANGRPTVSSMIVKGGATLAEQAADGSVRRALDATHYDDVVLQERGGDMICAYAPERCKASARALGALVRIIIMHGARPILLGTYQTAPQASGELVRSESLAAKRLSLAYVPLSERLQAATRAAPAAQWFHTDGMHPGHDLVLLEATLLYRDLFGALPRAAALTVHAPMFSPHAKFFTPAPTSKAVAPQDAEQTYAYAADTVAAVLAVATGPRAGK